MRSILRACSVCTAVGLLAAQTAPKPAKKETPPGILRSVSVKGNQRYTSEAILKQSGLHIGQHVTAAQIDAARQTLQDTQVFNNVADRYRYTIKPVSYDVTFEVSEVEQVFPVRFERLPVSSSGIVDYLQQNVPLYSAQIPGSDTVLTRYREAVQKFVAQSNPSVKVKVAASNDDPKNIAIVFSPDTPPPNISLVKVAGNEAVDTGTLLRAINNVAIGMPLTDLHLKEICDGTIKPVYAAHGYVAVTFPSIKTEPSKTDRGVIVSIQIKEGPIFKFGAIRFHGTGLDPDEVRSAIKFKPGQTYDAAKVDDFRIDLQHRLRRRGYLDASVLTDMTPDDANRVVSVTYSVAPGSLYTFAKLDIRGLDIETEPAIEKLWGEKPGKPFNPDYPDFFLKRVEEEKIFEHLSDTSSDYTADSSSHSVVVHLYFKGGLSKEDKARLKKEEEEGRKTDGTWSPY